MKLFIRIRALVLKIGRALEWLPPLLARIYLGVVFVHSGHFKFNHLPQITRFFASLHMPAPGLQARFVATNELLCGALVLLGLGTRVASIPLFFIMLVAIVTAKLGDIHTFDNFVDTAEIVDALLLLWLMAYGAGAVSLDRLVARRIDPAKS